MQSIQKSRRPKGNFAVLKSHLQTADRARATCFYPSLSLVLSFVLELPSSTWIAIPLSRLLFLIGLHLSIAVDLVIRLPSTRGKQ